MPEGKSSQPRTLRVREGAQVRRQREGCGARRPSAQAAGSQLAVPFGEGGAGLCCAGVSALIRRDWSFSSVSLCAVAFLPQPQESSASEILLPKYTHARTGTPMCARTQTQTQDPVGPSWKASVSFLFLSSVDMRACPNGHSLAPSRHWC